MGILLKGQWYPDSQYANDKGEFVRKDSQFRNWITPDGHAGPTGKGGFKAEANRYHLYVSYACPWASRALMMRSLKGLETSISFSVVNPLMLDNGWTFEEADGVIPDPVIHAKYLYEIYTHVDAEYSGRVTVPVLYDKKQNKIVSNESSDIIRMFNDAFNEVGANATNYLPKDKLSEIDEWNEKIYHDINNGVYKAGFATKQPVYEEAVTQLFKRLDEIEEILGQRRFLIGDEPTEADWRLFPTLVRFDAVYVGHFKCNLRQIREYKHLWRYTRELYHWPKIAQTVNMNHIKQHYYRSHKFINPTGIVPKGPIIDFSLD